LTQPRKKMVLAFPPSVCHNAGVMVTDGFGVMVTDGFNERKGFE
jgi:hypothetical protein